MIRAAVCRAFGEPLGIEELELAAPNRGELRIEIAACAICQSDIHYVDGAWGGTLPAVYGHEAAGVVAEVGAGVAGFEVGDHVVVTLIRSCGACEPCCPGRAGALRDDVPARRAAALCTRATGRRSRQGLRTGAFAEQVVVDASQAVVDSRRHPARPRGAARLRRDHRVRRRRQHGAGRAREQRRRDRHRRRRAQRRAGRGARRRDDGHRGRPLRTRSSRRRARSARRMRSTPDGDDVVEAVAALTGGRGADYVIVTVGAERCGRAGPLAAPPRAGRW